VYLEPGPSTIVTWTIDPGQSGGGLDGAETGRWGHDRGKHLKVFEKAQFKVDSAQRARPGVGEDEASVGVSGLERAEVRT